MNIFGQDENSTEVWKSANTIQIPPVNCYSELVDEDSLQYRVWCDRLTSHKCCKIQEMCYTNYNTHYGSEHCEGVDLLNEFKEYNLTEFEFQDSNETNPLETCEIFITVKGKNENAKVKYFCESFWIFTDRTKPLRVNIFGQDESSREAWKSANTIQIPGEEEIDIKVSEKCAIAKDCKNHTLYIGDKTYHSQINFHVLEPTSLFQKHELLK